MALAGKVGVVSGGTRGIGRAIVLELARAGAHVVASYVAHEEIAQQLAVEGRGLAGSLSVERADVTSWEAAQQLVARTRERHGRLDFLVNNAGITKDKALMLMAPEDWREVLEVNLTGAFHMSRAAIVTMMKQKAGVVLNISSISGVIGLARQVNYAASKAGLIGFTKALAREVAPYGIRVNAIAPGLIQTDMLSTLPGEQLARLQARVPMQRLGTPEDVAGAARYLLDDASGYLTGHVLYVDGGMAIGG